MKAVTLASAGEEDQDVERPSKGDGFVGKGAGKQSVWDTIGQSVEDDSEVSTRICGG